MASPDYYLNVAGTSLELFAVVFGGLASPLADGLRRWLREELSEALIGATYRFRFVIALIVVGSTIASVIGGVLGNANVVLITYGLIVLTLVAITIATLIGVFLSLASGDALRRVLEAMGLAFGVGVLLQLIAAATP